MNKKRVFALALTAAVLGVVATASVALADPTSSHGGGAMANQIGLVRIDPNNPRAAYVTGWYTCPAGTSKHLFVSVKQVANGSPDNRLKEEGSSQYTSAWLETQHLTPTPVMGRGTPERSGSPTIQRPELRPLRLRLRRPAHPRTGLCAVLHGRR